MLACLFIYSFIHLFILHNIYTYFRFEREVRGVAPGSSTFFLLLFFFIFFFCHLLLRLLFACLLLLATFIFSSPVFLLLPSVYFCLLSSYFTFPFFLFTFLFLLSFIDFFLSFFIGTDSTQPPTSLLLKSDDAIVSSNLEWCRQRITSVKPEDPTTAGMPAQDVCTYVAEERIVCVDDKQYVYNSISIVYNNPCYLPPSILFLFSSFFFLLFFSSSVFS